MSSYSLIEVSDICIRVYENARQVYAEPGIALLPANSAPLIGYQAQKLIRQQPTRIYSRFWSDLSTTPLSIKQTSIRHSADLVWHQLSQIKQCLDTDKVVFCLSSHLNSGQMQLLAGICESLGLRAHYLLNLGLAQLAQQELADSVTHLDLQLHQLVVSQFSRQDGKLMLQSQESVPGISYLQLIDRMVHALRDQFIQMSRFDPLHSGDTEQQLFDQVADLINSSSLKPVEIKTASQSYSVEPSPKDFDHVISTLRADLDKLVRGTSQRALCPVFSRLPGLKPSDTDIRLGLEDSLRGAEKLVAQQTDASDNGVLYISSMDADSTLDTESDKSVKTEPHSSLEPVANALLFQGMVYPAARISDLLNRIKAPDSAIEITDNGIYCTQDPASDQPLVINDEIQINQARMTAVQLLE